MAKTPQTRVGVLQLTLLVYTASRRRRSLVQNQIRPSVILRTTLIDNKENIDKMNTADNERNLFWQSCTACATGLAEFLRLASRFIQYNTCNYKDYAVSNDQ
jgi:phage terminase large subunit-like protein